LRSLGALPLQSSYTDRHVKTKKKCVIVDLIHMYVHMTIHVSDKPITQQPFA